MAAGATGQVNQGGLLLPRESWSGDVLKKARTRRKLTQEHSPIGSACIRSPSRALSAANPQAKAGARPVVLGEAARKLLQAQLEGHDSEWVFPDPNGRPYRRDRIGKV